jgi:hypothetical protein
MKNDKIPRKGKIKKRRSVELAVHFLTLKASFQK